LLIGSIERSRIAPSSWRAAVAGASAAFIAVACSSAASIGQPPADAQTCPPSTEQALINGATTESFLGLSDSQLDAIVQVVDATRPTDGPLCSGTFIAPDWVVSAQHCLVIPSLSISIHGSSPGSPPIFLLPVTRSIAHSTRDVALLHVDLPLTDGGSVTDAGSPQFAPLLNGPAGGAELAIGDVLELAGYGITETGGTRQLRFLAESVTAIDDTTISVNGFRANGACAGDSGGPILARSADGSAVILGVLSEGSSSCTGQDVYARLDNLKDWVAEAIGPPIADDRECGTIVERGRCLYGSALWCKESKLMAEPCIAGTACGWDVAQAAFRCVEPATDPCAGVDSIGACRDNAAIACNDGVLQHQACAACSECRVTGGNGAPHCVSMP
jgi:hypothetical protein